MSKEYRGYSTASNIKITHNYNLEVVKQDLLNNFNTRKGERIGNPTYGTIIWDMLFELNSPSNQQLIFDDVNSILKAEKRVTIDDVSLKIYENGLLLICDLTDKSTGQQFKLTNTFNSNLSTTPTD